MKAFDDPSKNRFKGLASSFSLSEKWPEQFRPDEHSLDGVLTFGFRTALPPSQFKTNQWLWEFVTRYSGATVLDFHEVPSVGYDWME